jgi:uncharacterized membrane protein YidH (DUF202 family)
MSDGKKMLKKKSLKEDIKLVAPLIPIVGIAMSIMFLHYNNAFMVFLCLWLVVLDYNLGALYGIYLSKDELRSPVAKRRLRAIRELKVETAMAYIITAIGILGGSLLLAAYLIYLRAVASGVTNIPAIITSQEAILTLLMLIPLPLLAYVVKRETEKAIRLGMENVTSA